MYIANIRKLFETLSQKFPYPPEIDSDYLSSYIEDKNSYINFLKRNKDDSGDIIESSTIEIVQEVSELIVNALKSYRQGNIQSFHENIINAFNHQGISEHWLNMLHELKDKTESHKGEPFYRIRIDHKNNLSSVYDIFHPPYCIRNKIRQQRFGFPGLPCLYVSKRLATPYLEFGKPNLEHTWVSFFNFEKSYTEKEHYYAVDIAQTFNVWSKAIRKDNDREVDFSKIKAALSLWPIIQACTYKRKNDITDPIFIEEYLIGNYLLTWIKGDNNPWTRKNKKILSIKYFSTKYNFSTMDTIDLKLGFNFVFWPIDRLNSNSNYCSTLKSFFSISTPKTLTSLEKEINVFIMINNSNLQEIDLKECSKKLELICGNEKNQADNGELYHNCAFGKIEDRFKSTL